MECGLPGVANVPSVAGEHGVHLAGQGLDQGLEEVGLRQPGNTVARQAAAPPEPGQDRVRTGSGPDQDRDGCRQGIEAVAEPKQSMPAKGNHHSFLWKAKGSRLRYRPSGLVPAQERFLHLAMVFALTPAPLAKAQALWTMVYRSTDCRCGAPAPSNNLSHSPSS